MIGSSQEFVSNLESFGSIPFCGSLFFVADPASASARTIIYDDPHKPRGGEIESSIISPRLPVIAGVVSFVKFGARAGAVALSVRRRRRKST